MSDPPKPKPEPIRILCLHGYTQSGPLFSNKTGALRKALTTALAPRPVELYYPTGPLPLRAEDIPGYEASTSTSTNEPADTSTSTSTPEAYGWWRRQSHPPPTQGKDITYTGLDETFTLLAEAVRTHGPFDGVLGFSQGACMAAMLAAVLDGSTGRKEAFAIQAEAGGMAFPAFFLREDDEIIQQPLKFVVLFAGFKAPGYEAFWRPEIGVRSLHVLGSLDVVVDEGRSQELVEVFEKGEIVVHPGGHFVPSAKKWLGGVCGFVRGCLDEKEDA